jgi:hypothetical protein
MRNALEAVLNEGDRWEDIAFEQLPG